MSRFPRTLKELCRPAALYFIVSIISLVVIVFQNLGATNTFTVGDFSCNVPNTFLVIISQFIYILFWTYVLNLICKDGHSGLSWLIVLLPIILFFVLMGLMLIM